MGGENQIKFLILLLSFVCKYMYICIHSDMNILYLHTTQTHIYDSLFEHIWDFFFMYPPTTILFNLAA